MGAPLAGCFEEGLEPLTDDLVQDGLLRLPSPVSAQGAQAAPAWRSQFSRASRGRVAARVREPPRGWVLLASPET